MRPSEIPKGLITVLKQVQEFAASQNVECFLVGGFLRDQLLGRAVLHWNVDLAVAKGAIGLARDLAAHLKGAFVPLDEQWGCARIVIGGTPGLELDISDFRGSTLEEDLHRRDFTINALAIRLQEWLKDPRSLLNLVDPLHGRLALERQQLIACFKDSFVEDPVRILRALRFQAQLNFSLDAATLSLIKQAASLLAQVSGERIRDELVLILQTRRCYEAVQSLNALGVLDILFPELVPGRGMVQGGVHHLDVLGHQIETLAYADRVLDGFEDFSEMFRAPLRDYCAMPMVEGRSRLALIKLAGLVHDVGKPANRQVHADGEIWFIGHEHTGAELAIGIVDRLRLSNRESQMICRIVKHHLRPGLLSREPQLTRRAIYRFYKDLQDDGPACLLTWWHDRLAARGSASRLDQLDQQRARLEEMLHPYFFKVEEVVRPPRLVDGHQLMQTLGLAAGPRIGDLLAAIEEAQAEGRVHSTQQALDFAREHLARGQSAHE